MGRACCVLGCTSGGDAPSHQIPKNPELFRKWKNMIYSEKIQHLTDEQIGKCTVCYRHFANDDYLVTYRVRKLKRGVAPSLNLPNKPIKEEPRNVVTESDTSTNISIKTPVATEVQVKEAIEEEEEEEECTFVVRLFEDLPETLESYMLERSSDSEEISEQSKQCQQLDINVERNNLVTKVYEANLETKILRRKRVRLTKEQLILFQCKKQAEKYAKTPTIQKLLSFITTTERSSLQSKIQRSKYSPKIYIRLYHDIAKRKAFGQL